MCALAARGGSCARDLGGHDTRTVGEVYNIGGGVELQNIVVVRRLLAALGKPESLIEHVADRAGHDRRYAMDTSRVRREFGWRPEHSFESGLTGTVKWYLDHRAWWERVLSEAYRASTRST